MASTPQSVSLWTYRKIPYLFDTNFPFKDDVIDAMNKWKEFAGVWFAERTTEPNYILLKQAGSSNSQVGMKGGPQTVNISNGYKALHELGHALGLLHEQCRDDRDLFIDVQWNYIDSGHHNNNFVISPNSQNLTPYDRLSVMHYPAPAIGWGGTPPNTEVWTMRWKIDRNQTLGPKSWTQLSDLDKEGLRKAYENVPVPMGPETAQGTFKFAYQVQFSFTIGGRVFYYGQNMNEKNWFIQELVSPGILGVETDNGTWKFAYEVQFPFIIDGRVFFYGQNLNEKNWFIQELLPGGKMGSETDHGTWKFAYKVQVPYQVGNTMFFFGQNLNEKNWFVQELLPGGKMGLQKGNGTWKYGYEVMFSYTIANKVFMYGQNLNEKNYFISEMMPDGTFGTQTGDASWKNAYKVQFTYNIGGNQYFYGQNLDTKYWFIQRLNPDGTMGEEIQNGFWSYPYAVQFPFAVAGAQYFYGQNLNGKNWFIQRLINV